MTRNPVDTTLDGLTFAASCEGSHAVASQLDQEGRARCVDSVEHDVDRSGIRQRLLRAKLRFARNLIENSVNLAC